MSEAVQKLAHTFGALAELGQEISESNNLEAMAGTSLHLVLDSLAIMRGSIAVFDHQTRSLRIMSRRGGNSLSFDQIQIESQLADRLAADGITVITTINFDDYGAEALRDFDDLGGSLSLLVPLVVRHRMLGLLFLGEKATGEAYTEDDLEILRAMARHIAVGLLEHWNREELERRANENRVLYDGMRSIYKETVRAFAAAIDCKDKYTQGHSERVGKYSEIIASELGWSDDEVEGIAIAGYLHDIGKLVVDRDIINAPYRIDAKQSSELNRHPAAGYEILSPIHHPYADIPLMARHHHERLDGRGYPDGLTSEEIPIGVKIVSLADSFDAMTTDRPYKRRREFAEVIDDLRRNTGKQFDRVPVLGLLNAIKKEMNGQNRDRRITKMLGRDYLSAEGLLEKLEELISEFETESSALKVS